MIRRTLETFLKYIGFVELSVLVSIILSFPLAFTSLGDVEKYWIYAIVMFLIEGAGLFFISFRDGYCDRAGGRKEIRNDCIVLSAIFVLQIIIGIPFYYTEYTSGPAMFFGYLVYWYTTHTMVNDLCDPPLWMPLIPLIVCDAILVPVWFCGKRTGCKKREQDRKRLTSSGS